MLNGLGFILLLFYLYVSLYNFLTLLIAALTLFITIVIYRYLNSEQIGHLVLVPVLLAFEEVYTYGITEFYKRQKSEKSIQKHLSSHV